MHENSGWHRYTGFCIDSLTWSRSGAAGREGGSSGVCTPPPGQWRRPGKWWPTPQWPRSPPSPWWLRLPRRLQAATRFVAKKKKKRVQSGSADCPSSTIHGRSSVEGRRIGGFSLIGWQQTGEERHYRHTWGCLFEEFENETPRTSKPAGEENTIRSVLSVCKCGTPTHPHTKLIFIWAHKEVKCTS